MKSDTTAPKQSERQQKFIDSPYQGVCGNVNQGCDHWHSRYEYCMTEGCKCVGWVPVPTPFPRKKAHVIQCHFSDCAYSCVHNEGFPLWEQVIKHLRVIHGIEVKREFMEYLQITITEIWDNSRIHYVDPFFTIPINVLEKNIITRDFQ